MVRRPLWSGQLKISLVQFGIQLFPATNPRFGITFHEVDRETRQRIHHLNVVGQNRPIDNTDIAKGYEYSKGKYIVIEQDEIAKLRIQSKNVLEVSQFADLKDIPLDLFERPYFVFPKPKEPVDAFMIIRKAMQQAGKAAIGELAFGGREHLFAIAVPGDESQPGLMAYMLRYEEELRKNAGYSPAIPKVDLDKKQLGLANELINAYSRQLRLGAFKDDYEAALHKLIDAKRRKRPLPLEEDQPKQPKVVDLMDALRQSVTSRRRIPADEKRVAARAAKKGPILVKSSKRKRKAA